MLVSATMSMFEPTKYRNENYYQYILTKNITPKSTRRWTLSDSLTPSISC
ncbi:hypothetical protein [Vibrio gallaecicus]|nr:hypothetical protein [Vibrio gallaecicus]MDN3613818.1 hypothetical protein [Vibrio gallaecicus]